MRFAWLLVGCMGFLAKAASNALEVDLVFPRNDTYAPADWFPIVFAFQNPEHGGLLNPRLSYTIWDWDDMFGNNSIHLGWSYDLESNWTSYDPYFAYNFFRERLREEGHYYLKWSVGWDSCDMKAFYNHGRGAFTYNKSTWAVHFTIKNSAQKVDLVAATANTTCPEEFGTAINITGQKTLDNGDTCAVVASSAPTPCQAKIDSAIAASMTASQHATWCRGLHKPAGCPEKDKSGAKQLMVIGVSCFLAAVGAIGFILM